MNTTYIVQEHRATGEGVYFDIELVRDVTYSTDLREAIAAALAAKGLVTVKKWSFEVDAHNVIIDATEKVELVWENTAHKTASEKLFCCGYDQPY